MSSKNIITLRQEQQTRLELQELRRDEFIGALGVWGPVTIPLIPASLTAIAIATHYPDLLDISPRISVILGTIAAGGIEVLGIVSTETFLQMRSYNQMRDECDEPAPAVAAGIVAGAYLAVVMALVVLLKVWSGLAIYSLLPLTALGALVSWIVVLRRQHGKRELAQLQRREADDQTDQLAAQIEQLTEQLADKTAQLGSAQTGQSTAQSLVTELTELNSQLTSRIEQFTDQIEQLTEQFAVANGRVESLESEKLAAQSKIDELTKLNSELNSEIDQLTSEIDQLSAQSTGQFAAKSEQLAAQRIEQFAAAKVYSNGDIVHGTEHMDTTGQIHEIAQRMVDSGQKVNKSKIAELVSCSRTTVQTALRDWEPG